MKFFDSFSIAGLIILLLAGFPPTSSSLAGSELSEEELERWFNSDSFEPPVSTSHVNDGDLVFLTSPGQKALHHHHNSLTILPGSLEDGWVLMEQCHTNLDKVSALQIVFSKDRIRELEVVDYQNIGRVWVEGSTVQLADISDRARVCLKAWSHALTVNNDGSYSLRNGPYMRRFLDGYYPIRVSMDIRYAGTGLRPTRVSPVEQQGFAIYRKTDSIGFDAVFEGMLRTEFNFAAETL